MSTSQDNPSEINLSDSSIGELQSLLGKVQDVIEVKQRQEIIDLYESFESQAKNMGFENLEDLHAKYVEYKAEMKKTKTRSPVEPVYRNKNNPSETWTGRGKPSRWLVAIAKERGVTVESILDEFRI